MKLLLDLANSCEYLNIDKTCNAFVENQKAQANRQLKCQNSQKSACCYLCIFREQCSISCKYLGQTENYTSSKLETESIIKTNNDKQTEKLPTESNPVIYCFSCNAEMACARTNFKVEGWKGPQPSLNCNNLSVHVYLCQKCGKIEFRADTIRNEVKP